MKRLLSFPLLAALVTLVIFAPAAIFGHPNNVSTNKSTPVAVVPNVPPTNNRVAMLLSCNGKLDSGPCPGESQLSSLTRELARAMVGVANEKGEIVEPGAISLFASGIGYMATTKPASSVSYFRYLTGRLHFPGTPTPAYAASVGGIGYDALAPVLPFWIAMRNVAYVAFAVIFTVVGFMVMFRVKIDPKTAATVQSALPKMILALLVVTFSYAIAGFLVDIMYVTIALVIAAAQGIAQGISGLGSLSNDLGQEVGRRSIFWFFLNGGFQAAINAGEAVFFIVQQFLNNTALESLGGVLGAIGQVLAMLIVAIAILWALFKTWLTLLSAYANILLSIIFSPILLMMDAIPGQNQLGNWLRTMLSYLLAFPVTIGMIFIALALSRSPGISPEGGFVPPLLGGNSQAAMQAIVGIAILLTTPKVVEMVQAALKPPESKFGSAWGEALGAGTAVVQAGRNYAWEQSGIPGARIAYQKEQAEKRAGARGPIGTWGGWRGFLMRH